jgi:alpha-tubulin suppressor-like RCC1 family protein
VIHSAISVALALAPDRRLGVTVPTTAVAPLAGAPPRVELPRARSLGYDRLSMCGVSRSLAAALGMVLPIAMLASSCAQAATQVLVWVEVPEGSAMRARATSIRARVFDQDGTEVRTHTAALTGAPPILEPPISISLLPRDGDASRRFRVEVALVDDSVATGEEFAIQSAEGTFVPGELREIRLRFDDECLGVACSIGRTCIRGRCERACFEGAPAGTTERSVPAACPCECACEGDLCEGGLCIPRAPVTAVAAGFAHACAIVDGSLRCWGDNASGQLGVGDRERRAVPTPVTLADRAAVVSLGEAHSCAVLADGSLWCWGSNAELQLGVIGPDSLAPQRLDARAWATVGAGARHTCAIAASGGRAHCWGDNWVGQTSSDVYEPQLPLEVMAGGSSLGGFSEVLAGAHHTCVRQASASRLWCWGSNGGGVLGRELPWDSSVPNPIPEQVAFPDPTGVRQAAAGGWHMLAISGDNQIYAWGDPSNGRLGIDPAGSTNVRMPTLSTVGITVDAGLRHTCVIREDTSLVCFGQNERGELGTGSEALFSSTPLELRDTGWESISLGTEFSCGIRRGGALYCWGNHANCRLGIGEPCEAGATPVTRRTPTRVCF